MTENSTHPQMLIQNSIVVFFIFLTFPTSHSQEDEQQFSKCNTTAYSCGTSVQPIGYPFWGDGRPDYCGHSAFELKCQNNDYATIDIGTHTYRVIEVNESSYTIRMARLDLWDNHCPQNPRNMSIINNPRFGYSTNVRNLSIYYNCTQNDHGIPNNFTCGGDVGFYADESFSRNWPAETSPNCKEGIQVPVPRTSLDRLLSNGQMGLQEVLNWGFEVVYNYAETNCSRCVSSAGTCGSFPENGTFLCLCHDHPYSLDWCQNNNNGNPINMKRKLIIGVSAGMVSVGLLVTYIIIYCIKSKTSLRDKLIVFWKKKTTEDLNLETFIKHYGSLAPKRFSYLDVKKMTNSFREKLGEGGYGGVYKGKLPDGSLVAVKILKKSKGKGEEFINEVASISRTSHVNVVTLLGFCFEGHKRALIYEFMPNGSLEKFIYSSKNTSGHLGWEKMDQIVIGIARGLEYLHRGCNTRILHLDIKPHNILLDEDFCPKIADFGLAKLCTKNESIVSMLEARGTIGYIAPEVFSRNFGGVSHKSDVYSFGMMVLEMVGAKNKIAVAGSQSSEIYFPHWIYRRLELDQDLLSHGLMTQEESEIVKKMIIVGLWCIQTNSLQRPSMSKVIEMLEGSIEDLKIPPKPFISSPPRSPQDSSSTLVDTTEGM